MKTDILTTAQRLPDADLLARLDVLASRERDASVELVAHLAALDARPALYAAKGYGSLFSYCTQALHVSEDAACNRIEAARACRRFPVILDRLASGSLSLTSVRLLARRLTPENHQAVLAMASGRTRREIDSLLAELAPRPDVAASIRKLPVRESGQTVTKTETQSVPTALPAEAAGTNAQRLFAASHSSAPESASSDQHAIFTTTTSTSSNTGSTASCATPGLDRRPIVQATAPGRYRMQFTIGAEAHDNFRRLQALLRREFPDGDPGAIVERALALLLEKVEKTKLAAASRPRPTVIRSGTDSPTSGGSSGRPSRRPAVGQLNGPRRDWITADYGRPAPAGSHTTRYIPRDVKRAVWSRDAGQCAFQSAAGARCSERAFLEFHHIQPYARQGTATVTNISLRCRRHNQYEAELVFGPATRRLKREPTVT